MQLVYITEAQMKRIIGTERFVITAIEKSKLFRDSEKKR